MKKSTTLFLCAALLAVISCGGNSNSKSASDNDVQEETKAPVVQKETKAPAKKWYEKDFSLTYKQYVLGNSIVRSYARKGNVVACNVEGGSSQKLYVFTDSTRTEYILNPSTGKYVKGRERSDFANMDDGIKMLLKNQMGDNVFTGVLKPDKKNGTVKDTTVFGRPAYVIIQEKTEVTFGVETYTKVIEWVDKENALPYYKYGLGKAGDKLITDGKVFEITAFSANPTYEGFIISLDGLTEVTN